ncbi:MAG: gamma-glutamyl-gamma-aminobutyrate hydrolase family protein [Bacteroidales bacterium]|nr:gamma-glutamyl-gamma-aminobutyrate hydrolase family protein [Bacteroidales bacterium]
MNFRLSFPILILILSTSLFSAGQDTLLLFHPTVYNLEVIQKLMEEELFPLEGYHVLGVYHPGETYDYRKTKDYIDQKQTGLFSIRQIKGELGAEHLFRKNSASEEFRELFKCSEGALFMGGPDIPPSVYGEKVHLLTAVTDPFRHYLELSYLFHLLGGTQDREWVPYLEQKPGYLINGICLGMQTLHVATGGTLIQDIPTELYGIWNAEDLLSLPPDQMHRNYQDYLNTDCADPTSYHFHKVTLSKGETLSRGIGFRSGTLPLVLSSHHQAIEKLGPDWMVTATSMDGRIIEGIRHRKYPHVLGIQFHPEKPGLFDPSIHHPSGCHSTINFQEAIANSDSYKFHVAFWNYLGRVLQKNRE